MASTSRKRTQQDMEDDALIIANLMTQSYGSRRISQHLNQVNAAKGYTLSHVQVFKDQKKILEQWREERNHLIDAYTDRELAKLDMMEYEAWQAWHASKGGKSKTKIVGGQISGGKIISSDPGSTERTTETTNGDPRFMVVITQCMDRRASLLGIGQTKKVEHIGSIGVSVTNLDREEIEKEEARMLESMSKRAFLTGIMTKN